VRKPTDNPALYKVLGRKIATARVQAAGGTLSQSGLAKKVGLTRGSIANIELGTQRAPLHVLWAIGHALGMEPASLLPHSTELEDAADALLQDHRFEPAVARVVEEMPIARAWLSATRSRLDVTSDTRPERKRKS
jgi:transcriptional regulator with XRE-family HTH domain